MYSSIDLRWVLFLLIVYIISVSIYTNYMESFKKWESISTLTTSVLLLIVFQCVHIFNP